MSHSAIALDLVNVGIAYDRDHAETARADWRAWRVGKERELWRRPDVRDYVDGQARRLIAGDRAIRFLSDNLKTGSKANGAKVKGLSVNVSIARSCAPTAQCSACYASEPGQNITRLDALLGNMIRQRAFELDALGAAARIVSETDRAGIRRRLYSPALGAHFLRWFGVGDLTMPSADAIVAVAGARADLLHGIFSRKPDMIAYLLRRADAAGVSGQLSINFSVDGTPSDRGLALTYARLGKLKDLGVFDRVRLVQFLRPGDHILESARVTFAEHSKRDQVTRQASDCPAIRDHNVGCLDCGTCFVPTSAPAPRRVIALGVSERLS